MSNLKTNGKNLARGDEKLLRVLGGEKRDAQVKQDVLDLMNR
jgi:hypothetical protein